MGNDINCNNNGNTKSTKLKNIVQLALKKNTSQKTKCTDQFFIEHVQNNQKNDNFVDINALDQRRVVFVSLIGIYLTWRCCPSATLYTALFVLPLKRKWIYKPSKHDNAASNPLSQISIFSDSAEKESFISLLKWKDSQNLVFWMCDEYESRDADDCKTEAVDPFWHDVSAQLSKLYDPITANNYNPLKLDAKWWENKQKFSSKYNTKTSSILDELYFLTMKFKTIQEIFYQSNPNSLCPLKSYAKSLSYSDVNEETSICWLSEHDEWDMNGSELYNISQ